MQCENISLLLFCTIGGWNESIQRKEQNSRQLESALADLCWKSAEQDACMTSTARSMRSKPCNSVTHMDTATDHLIIYTHDYCYHQESELKVLQFSNHCGYCFKRHLLICFYGYCSIELLRVLLTHLLDTVDETNGSSLLLIFYSSFFNIQRSNRCSSGYPCSNSFSHLK